MRVDEGRRDQPAVEVDDPVGAVLEVHRGVVVADPDDGAVLDAERGGVRVGGRVDVAAAQQECGVTVVHPHSRRSNRRAHPRVPAQQRQRVVGVAGHVAVADQHRHVGGQALGAERGGAERRRHREEDHRAAVGGGQDRAVLAAGHVDADDGDVGRAAGRCDGRGQRDRVAGVGDRDLVGEPGAVQQVGLGLGAARRRSCGARRRRCAAASDSEPDLPAPPITTTTAAATGSAPLDVLPHHPGGQRRRAAHVHHRQRQLGRQVVGEHGRDRAAEQDRVAVGRHLLGAAVPAGQAVLDHQRRQRQRDQRGDPVADRQPERRLRADLLDGADQHAAGAGDRVLHLAAACATMSSTSARTAVAVAVVLALELAEGRRVEVEPLDPDPHLVGPQLAAGVEPLGRLRQHARRREHAVQADRAAVAGSRAVLPSSAH